VIAAIVLLALALRLGWIAYASFTPTLSDDAGRYDLLGRSLADNAGYINPNGTTTMFWPPGYPLVLASVYKLWPEGALGDHEVSAALALNAVLGAATVLLVYAIGRRAFDDRTAMLGALLTALFPSLIFLTGVTLTETLFTFLALLAVWLIIELDDRRDGAHLDGAPRAGSAGFQPASRRPGGSLLLLAVTGVVIGFAALVRGQALLLPLVALPFWWRATGRLRDALLRAAGTAAIAMLVVAPWTVRNYDVSGSLVVISSNAGVDFYIGHSPGADGRGRIVDDLVFRYPDRPQPEAEVQINRDGFREGIEYAAKHPLREVTLSARKLFWLYDRDDEALKWNEAHGEHRFLSAAARTTLAAVSNVYYWLVLALAVAGIRSWLSLRDPARLLLVSLVAYWTLVHVAFFGDPRFHASIMPVVALFAACGLNRAFGRIRPRARVPA